MTDRDGGHDIPHLVRRLFQTEWMYGSDPNAAGWDEIIVACAQVQDMPAPNVPSEIHDCADCNQPVWVRHGMVSDIVAMHRQDVTILCLQCAVKRADEGGAYTDIREI